MTDARAVTEASPDANPAAPSSEPMYSVTVALLSAPVVPMTPAVPIFTVTEESPARPFPIEPATLVKSDPVSMSVQLIP